MKPGVVQGQVPGEEFRLRYYKPIKSEKDLKRIHPDFGLNLELAIDRKDPADLYFIDRYKRGKKKSIGELLWFPTFNRAGIVTWKDWQEGIFDASWTDAGNELDALSRWVWDDMADDQET